MDKVLLKFIADVLYVKGYIYYSEFEAMMEACNADDLDRIIEGMLNDEFKGYKKGEGYTTSRIKL